MRVQSAVVELVELNYQRAYDRHWDDVFRFVLAWTNDWGAAEDLAQETYLRLWQHRANLDWDRPILPWLLVAARHLATNRFHALRRRVLPRRSEPSSDEAVRTRWLDVRTALDRLSPLERSALLLTTIEGWSYAELARVLGTSDGALRAAVSRARTKLEVA
jgi:RNA polymerase sigma-70 factor (ECF subfamily)